MRFVLVSTHIDQTTGYSKVSFNLLRQLSTLVPKVKIYHYGFQRHPARAGLRKYPEGVISYDAAANEDPREEGFGFNKINEYLEMVSPDVVMIYNDPLIIAKFLETMKHDRKTSPYKLWIYVDQVYEGIAPPLINMLCDHADRVYCFTDIWKQRLLKYAAFQDVRVLEHSVDPLVFTSMPIEGRRALRNNMNLPDDATVFLNINRNSQRKRLDLTIAGFVELLSRNPTKPYYLMLVTNGNPQAGAYYDNQRIFFEELERRALDPQRYIPRLLFVDTSPNSNVMNDDVINQIYNIADVGINTSDGEGYGLCQLEHLYTGAPQVVTDIGSYRSFLTDDVAVFIPPSDRIYFAGAMPLGLWANAFNVKDVADAMEKVAAELPKFKKAAADHSIKSWSTICDGWLEDILSHANASQVATVSVPVKS